MELDPVEVAGRVGQAGERRRVGLGRGPEALGQPGDRVAVAHPDRLVALEAGEQAVVVGDRDARPARTRAVGRQHVAAELPGHQVRAVADPENRDPTGPDGRIWPGRVVVVHGIRAAGEDDRARTAPFQLLVGRVVRKELGIDVELAHSAGDQLGELAAEVEHDHGRSSGGSRTRGSIVGGSVWSGRLERGLEVGLDLGVVGGEHAVAGIGRLAVDRLAALPGFRARVAQLARFLSVASAIVDSVPPLAVSPACTSVPAVTIQPIGRLRGVAHRLGGRSEVATEFVGDLRRRRHLREGGPHVQEPAVSGIGSDRERRVSHPEARMAALIVVGGRAAPVLDQEQGEPAPGRLQVELRVDRTEHRVGCHPGSGTRRRAPRRTASPRRLVLGPHEEMVLAAMLGRTRPASG